MAEENGLAIFQHQVMSRMLQHQQQQQADAVSSIPLLNPASVMAFASGKLEESANFSATQLSSLLLNRLNQQYFLENKDILLKQQKTISATASAPSSGDDLVQLRATRSSNQEVSVKEEAGSILKRKRSPSLHEELSEMKPKKLSSQVKNESTEIIEQPRVDESGELKAIDDETEDEEEEEDEYDMDNNRDSDELKVDSDGVEESRQENDKLDEESEANPDGIGSKPKNYPCTQCGKVIIFNKRRFLR